MAAVLGGEAGNWLAGLKQGAIGWIAGFVGLWLVVELGKLAFGKKAMKFDKPVEWHLREPEGDEDPMCFVISGDAIPWWDMFSRKSDRLLVECADIRVDGESAGGGTLTGSSLVLAQNQNATCTISNDDQPATLTLLKNLVAATR